MSTNAIDYMSVYTDRSKKQPSTTNRKTGDNVFEMNDFFKLLASQLKNQDIMNPMKENEFMAQMAQMATVQAMKTFTDVAVTSYSASLVGKEVTVAEIGKGDNISEVSGTVTGAGLYGGEHVIFVNNKSYYLSQIMAVGKLPPKEQNPETSKKP